MISSSGVLSLPLSWQRRDQSAAQIREQEGPSSTSNQVMWITFADNEPEDLISELEPVMSR